MLEKIIAAISPGWALKRRQEALKVQALNTAMDSFRGASFTRRQTGTWFPFTASADQEASSITLSVLRSRSRDLYKNDTIGRAAIRRQICNVVGTGLTPRSEIDAVGLGISNEEARQLERVAEREFSIFARQCDMERTLSFTGIQTLAMISALTSGDVFINTPFFENPGDVYGLKLQVIEADRVCNPGFTIDTKRLVSGVEKDERGAPSFYHVLNSFPGDILNGNPQKWEALRVFGEATGERRVFHLYEKERPGQTRGVPILTPILEPLKQLGRYRDAEIMAAVVGSMFAVFVKSESDSMPGNTVPGAGNLPAVEVGAKAEDELHVEGGSVVTLSPGESIDIANPQRPNAQYEPFVLEIMKEIGAGLDLPLEELLLFYQSSYSAARASILQAFKLYIMRRAWMADQFLNGVWLLFWLEAVARGRIPVTRFDDPARRAMYTGVRWIGPARGAINSLQEARAARERIEMGISTIDQESAELKGLDGDKIHERLADENRRRVADGLQPIGARGVSNNAAEASG